MTADNEIFKKNITLSRKAFASIGVPSPCSSGCEGVNIIVELHLYGPLNPKTDLVVNLTDVDKVLKKVIEEIDHKNLALDIPEFKSKNIEPRFVAEFILEQCQKMWFVNGVKVKGLTLYWGTSLRVTVQASE